MMLKIYYVMGAKTNQCILCVGTMVMLLVSAKMDECGEAVNVFHQSPLPDVGCNIISAWEWMREWSDTDQWADNGTWAIDATMPDFE